MYENLYKDILESSFILNLGILSVATFYIKEESENDNSQHILSSISVGITLIVFIGILLFHTSRVVCNFRQTSLLLSTVTGITSVYENTTAGDEELHAVPSSTAIVVDLRESLLEITESQTTAY